MKVPVISIGNSKGIRLNKMQLDKYQIHHKVELIPEPNAIMIRPIIKPRHDWDKAFSAMRKNEDDSLVIASVLDNKDSGLKEHGDQVYEIVVINDEKL